MSDHDQYPSLDTQFGDQTDEPDSFDSWVNIQFGTSADLADPILKHLPMPRHPDSNSRLGLADFDSLDDFIQELFLHAIEVCRLFCPQYWAMNRNIYSVCSITPEDMAQMILAKVWAGTYLPMITNSGGKITFKEKTEEEIRKEEERARAKGRKVKKRKNHSPPLTIRLFRSAFFAAARNACRVQLRYQRAVTRKEEESWHAPESEDGGRDLSAYIYNHISRDDSERPMSLSPNACRLITLHGLGETPRTIREALPPGDFEETIKELKEQYPKSMEISEDPRWSHAIRSAAETAASDEDLSRMIRSLAVPSATKESGWAVPPESRKAFAAAWMSKALLIAFKHGGDKWDAMALCRKLVKTISFSLKSWAEKLGEPLDLGDCEKRRDESNEDFQQRLEKHNERHHKFREGLLINLLTQHIKVVATNPEPEDLYSLMTKDTIRDEVAHGKATGKIGVKSTPTLIAEFVSTLPEDVQKEIYTSLLSGELFSPTGSHRERRSQRVEANARAMLYADYKVISAYARTEITPSSSPLVVLRLLHEVMRENPDRELPPYIQTLLDALRQSVWDSGSTMEDVEKADISMLKPIVDKPAPTVSTIDRGVNVSISDSHVSVYPVGGSALSLWNIIGEHRLWHEWCASMGCTSEFKPNVKPNTKGGGGTIRLFGIKEEFSTRDYVTMIGGILQAIKMESEHK